MPKRPLPDDFKITPSLRTWANQHCPRLDLEYHTAEFTDHWLSTGKQKADWDATWRNWMRRAFAGQFGQPRLTPLAKTPARDDNVVSIGLLGAARAAGIDPTGMTEQQIDRALWEVQQRRKQ
jgi:hypothetical protein